jgi:hypothetical protein
MGGGGKGDNESGKDLGRIANAFFDETRPLRRNLTDQLLEALKTGGAGAQLPIVNKAVESSNRATSNTLRNLDEQLAQFGLTGTPFGVEARTQAEQQGRYQTSQIEPNFVMQMLSQIPGFVTGANQTVVSGLGQAAGAEAQSQQAGAQWLSALLSPFSFSFGKP